MRAREGAPTGAHRLILRGAAALACALALPACHHAATAAAAAPALRFTADADSAGVTVVALDGTIRLEDGRARIHVDAGSYSPSWVPGSLTLAYVRPDSSGSWRIVTASAPVAPERWVLRPGMVWVPLDIEVPVPAGAGRDRGRLAFVVERRRPELPVDTPERWYAPVEVRP